MKQYSDHRRMRGGAPSAVAIGNFDGVHLGHRALLKVATSAPGLRPTVLTFDPHPLRLFAPDRAPPLLCDLPERMRRLRCAGVTQVLVQRFDHAFAALSPKAFATEVLHEALSARLVIVGDGFTFGARRSGDVDTLRALGDGLGFNVHVIGSVHAGGDVVSSSRIRALVAAGRIATANTLLGEPYCIKGRVVEGERRGRTLGFPTANLASANELLPKVGVYATWLDWGEGPHAGVTAISHKPTFGGRAETSIETHVLTGCPDLYGRTCRLRFVAHLRDERRFDGVEALVAAIRADKLKAAAALGLA